MSLMTGLVLMVIGFWILLAATGRSLVGRMIRGLWALALLAGWIAFAYLALGTAGGLEGGWAWVRVQPILMQAAMWLFLLPYMVALWIGQSDWALWVKVVLIGFIAVSLLAVASAPPKGPSGLKPRRRAREAW